MNSQNVTDAALSIVLQGGDSTCREALISQLRDIVGSRFLLTQKHRMSRYTTGYRYGAGNALAVVKPGTLLELWEVSKACVAHGAIVIVQAANTGLTGGSTPDGDYDRDVVLVSTLRLNRLRMISGGKEVVCFAGATLDKLERALAPIGREPHSVIGSSCIGASVVGGVCNNSGGALIKRGPAFTRHALFGRVNEAGDLILVNHLGIELGEDPEQVLASLEAGTRVPEELVAPVTHEADYEARVRDVDEPTPARYNADPRALYEASGCAGHLIVFAVRLPTFEAERNPKVFYVGTNDAGALKDLRRAILSKFSELPISAEYIHVDAIRIAEKYGRDTMLAIRWMGTQRLPWLYAAKAGFDRLATLCHFPVSHLSDKILQSLSGLVPIGMPRRIRAFRDQFQHHLIIKCSDTCANEMQGYLNKHFSSEVSGHFECDTDEGSKALLLRFSVAGAAIRYRTMHQKKVSDIVAIDVALKRNEENWFERFPGGRADEVAISLFYGHFLCHVFHLDYAIAAHADPDAIEKKFLAGLKQHGCEYPAEHNVGHHYAAKENLAAFYRSLDPTNALNPGVGQVSRMENWGEA